MKNKTFAVTDDHIRLSKRMFVEWNPAEFGAPTIDPRRPYGNSDVNYDIVELLGWTTSVDDDGYNVMTEEQIDLSWQLHKEMQTALQIWLCTGSIRTGLFEKMDKYDATSWKFVE